MNHDTNNEWLIHRAGVGVAAMRTKLRNFGFDDLDELVVEKKEYITSVCLQVRKSDGQPDSKEVPIPVERWMNKALVLNRYHYITQRTMDWYGLTRAHMNALHSWFTQLQKDPDGSLVATFSSNLNKRRWFESINQYLGNKKGAAATNIPFLRVDLSGQCDLPERGPDLW